MSLALVLCLASTRAAFARRADSTDSARVIPAELAPSEIFSDISRLRQQRTSPRADGPADALDRFVADVWKQLRVPDRWNGRCGACDSMLLEELAPSRWVVLRMAVAPREFRFLAFLAPLDAADTWRFGGHADTTDQYGIPSYHEHSTADATYLVVSANSGGTGMYAENQSWVELNPDRAVVALTYPTGGNESPFLRSTFDGTHYLASRTWNSSVTHWPDAASPSVQLELNVTYTFEDDAGIESDLFVRKQRAVYAWDAASRTYRFDETRSDVAREELASAYQYDTMNQAAFLKYNIQALRRIASAGTPAQKNWLRGVLAAGADPLAQELRRLVR